MTKLSYDTIIATRNRPEALLLSLPCLLAQSPPPDQVIVVDSSDDHAAVVSAVETATSGWEGRVIVKCTKPGLPHQRNVGLALVQAPVVLFLDDDSILYPNAAAAMLAVYERDEIGSVSGVCAAEAMVPPDGFPGAMSAVAPHHLREARWRRGRNLVERWLPVLKPSIYLGRWLNGRHPPLPWLGGMVARPVEYMTGFRMSFRTKAIWPTGFDETLEGYALDEDVDASFTAMRSGLVVGTDRARIYHHRAPSGRADPQALGRMEVLNRAYVLLKHAGGPCGSRLLARRVWRMHLWFTVLKLALTAPKAGQKAERDRLRGAWKGLIAAWRLRYG